MAWLLEGRTVCRVCARSRVRTERQGDLAAMTKHLSLSLRPLGFVGAALLILLPSFPARAGDDPLPPAGLRPVSGTAGSGQQFPLAVPVEAAVAASTSASNPSAPLPVVVALRTGETVRVDGVKDRRFQAANGAGIRALPGAVFAVLADKPDVLTLRLDEGTLADVGGTGRVEIWTRAFDVKADRAAIAVRDLPGGVYVEHVAGSTGTVTLVTSSHADIALAAGTFRMATFDDAAAAAPTAGRVTPSTPVVTTTSYPSVIATPRVLSVPSPAAVTSRAVVMSRAPVMLQARRVGATEWVDDSQGRPVVPAPGPCVGGCNPCAPAPAYVPCAPPCAPVPVCTTGCGEMITTSGVPIPDRADDAGRIPLGSAIGARGPCNSCAGTECNRIPYVHYVEGLVCDVSTYKVGCCLITVRPASRVRVHRLPDGSLELWAPNIGKDLALIEINDNQFGYIGDDGFLVIGNDCQIEYFRGLVHLYPHRYHHDHDHPRPPENQIVVSEDRVNAATLPGSAR